MSNVPGGSGVVLQLAAGLLVAGCTRDVGTDAGVPHGSNKTRDAVTPQTLETAADSSIVLTPHSISPNVENGVAFDRGAVDISSFKKLVVPDRRLISRHRAGACVTIYVQKQLLYLGHPEGSMSIREERKSMGCAVRAEGDALILATYGDWTTIEGGAGTSLSINVPEGVEVQERPGLSGPTSEGRARYGELKRRKEGTKACWYPPKPEEGWRALPTLPAVDKNPESLAP